MINYRNNPELFNIADQINVGSQIMVKYRFNTHGEYAQTRKPLICKVVAVFEHFCTVEHVTDYGYKYYEDICYTDLLTGRHSVYNY